MRARISRRSRYRLTVLEPVYHPIERHKTKTGIERYRERARELFYLCELGSAGAVATG